MFLNKMNHQMAKLHANTGCWVRPRPGPEPGAWPEVVVSQRSSWLLAGPGQTSRYQISRYDDTGARRSVSRLPDHHGAHSPLTADESRFLKVHSNSSACLCCFVESQYVDIVDIYRPLVTSCTSRDQNLDNFNFLR